MMGNTILTSSASHRSSTIRYESESSLVAGLLDGDNAAWRQFHKDYDRLIFRCITKVTSRFGEALSSEDVNEIYSTFLLQLLSNDKRKLRGFDPTRGTKFSTWIGMLAINASYDHLRSVRRKLLDRPIEDTDMLRTEGDDPLEMLERKERRALLEQLMVGLSDKDREFMTLYFGLGLSPDEVASRMKITVKTVYSKKHKIRAKLVGVVQRQKLAA